MPPLPSPSPRTVKQPASILPPPSHAQRDLHKGVITLSQIIQDLSEGGPHTTLGAVAILATDQLRHPPECGVVDCFGNIESEIETAMITTSEDQHELPRKMLRLGYLQIGVLLDQVVRIKEGSLMPQVLTALAEVFREEGLCLSL